MSKDSNNFPKQSRTFKRNTNPKVPNLLNHSNNKIKKQQIIQKENKKHKTKKTRKNTSVHKNPNHSQKNKNIQLIPTNSKQFQITPKFKSSKINKAEIIPTYSTHSRKKQNVPNIRINMKLLECFWMMV